LSFPLSKSAVKLYLDQQRLVILFTPSSIQNERSERLCCGTCHDREGTSEIKISTNQAYGNKSLKRKQAYQSVKEVKETVSQDFRPLVFFIKQSHLGPWLTGLSLFAYGFEFAKIFDYEIADFCNSGVNDTAVSNALISSWRSYFVTMGLKLWNAPSCLFAFLSFYNENNSLMK
jgi:hypothetical protein